jgi:hypothetical protein
VILSELCRLVQLHGYLGHATGMSLSSFRLHYFCVARHVILFKLRRLVQLHGYLGHDYRNESVIPVVFIFLYLRAIFCTFQISVDFYFVPVGGRGGAGEGEGYCDKT